MSFLIPGALRAFTEGRARMVVEVAKNPVCVHDALDALWLVCPGLRDRILTEQGEVRPHVNVFVGQESVQRGEGFAMPVPDGAEIAIFPAVSGG